MSDKDVYLKALINMGGVSNNKSEFNTGNGKRRIILHNNI